MMIISFVFWELCLKQDSLGDCLYLFDVDYVERKEC